VSLFPDNGQSTDVLMKFADSALSVVKDEGKKTYRYYQASMMEHLSEHLELSRDLKHALASTGLVLHYQPRVHAETGMTLAAETLIRWQHPTRGFLLPAAFLGVAEKANLMTVLDAWVLRETCQQLRTWQEQNVPYTLSCNLSGDSFKDETFADKLIALLQQEGVEPKRLELEITENTLLKHPEKAANQLQKLKVALPGLRIAIDDFGTGYSSLAYLRYLPVDILKIDRLFVRDLDHADERHRYTAQAVITTIISLGHQLELNVIAEGVETESQIQILTSLGCKEIQGYAFSKPLPLEEFKKFSHAETNQGLRSSNDEVTA
jgi:diguanylate cyclase